MKQKKTAIFLIMFLLIGFMMVGGFYFTKPEETPLFPSNPSIPTKGEYTGDSFPVIDPPSKKIIDVYHDSLVFLKEGKKVMVILNDGFSYEQYEHMKKRQEIPFMAGLPEPEKAMVAYPTVTPVNVAASLTGEWPNINGVTKRGIRQTEVPTIFEKVLEMGLSGEAVIGPVGTIELEITPLYSVDENNNGSTDDEKTENALKIMREDPDFLFVHYKDVDAYGHNFGPKGEKTLEAITRNDEYLKTLISQWEGKVILYSDHGMHETPDGGNHGSLRYEDLIIPYWIVDGGVGNE